MKEPGQLTHGHSPGQACHFRAIPAGCLLVAAALTILACFAVHAFPATEARNPAQSHADLGLQLARQGDLVRAESELRQAAQLAPADPEILAAWGTVLAMQNKLEESSQVFQTTLALSPHDMTVRRYLAANLWQLHRYPEAKQNLKILLAEKPNDGPARLLFGMVSENLKDYATAARMLASVPQQVRQQVESIEALARSYYHLGQTGKARATLAELSDHPAAGQAVFAGAKIADEMRDYETAQKMLLSIASTYPDPATLGYQLASVQYHAGRFEDSQSTLLGVIAAGNASAPIYNLLGWSYYRQTQPGKAVAALHRAIELAPEEEVNYQDLGTILVAERLLPAALELARKATTVFPNSADTFELQGSIEAKMRQFADARRSYSRAVELDATRPDGLLGLAQAQFASGNRKQAIDSLEAGVKRFPRDSRFPVLYASVLLKEAETSGSQVDRRVEEMLRSALALDPTLPGVHYELGKLALNAGRLPEALEHLQKAAALDPQSTETHFALSRAYRRAGNRQAAAQQMEIFEKLQRTETPMEMPPPEPETRN